MDEHPWLRDDKHIVEFYYGHAEALAKQLMPGATAAFAFNHVRRVSRQTEALKKKARHAAGLSAPSYMVHTDSTNESWLHNVRDLVARDAFGGGAPHTCPRSKARRWQRRIASWCSTYGVW